MHALGDKTRMLEHKATIEGEVRNYGYHNVVLLRSNITKIRWLIYAYPGSDQQVLMQF